MKKEKYQIYCDSTKNEEEQKTAYEAYRTIGRKID